MKATIYKVKTYQAFMASENGIRFMTMMPKDTTHYKHELLGEYTVVLPDGFYVDNGDIWQGDECAEIATDGGDICLLTSNGVTRMTPIKRKSEPIRKGTRATWDQTMEMLSELTDDEQQLLKDAMLNGFCGCAEMEFADMGGSISKMSADGFCMKDAVKEGHFTLEQIEEMIVSIRRKMCHYHHNRIGRNISVCNNWIEDGGTFLFIRSEYRNCILLWKDGVKMPDFKIENTKECARKWIEGGYPCIYRSGWRWKGASASSISQSKAMELLPKYSFGMGFYELSFINERGVDCLEFNELGENDLL